MLSRVDVVAKISFHGATPSNEELRKSIAAKLKADESLTVIKHIYTEFGSQEADVEAFVYDDKKVMAVLEKKAKKQKEKEAKQAEAKEAPVEEKKPETKEAPVEEKKPGEGEKAEEEVKEDKAEDKDKSKK